MQKQQLLGFAVVVIIFATLFWFFRDTQPIQETETKSDQTMVEDLGEKLSTQLGVSIPDDVERITLTDLRGEGATGLATRNYRDGLFSHSVLAALPDLTSNTYYQGWLVRGSEGEENRSVISTGRLGTSKGGYLLEYSTSQDLMDHNQVWVTVETQDDNTPETRVLEGNF